MGEIAKRNFTCTISSNGRGETECLVDDDELPGSLMTSPGHAGARESRHAANASSPSPHRGLTLSLSLSLSLSLALSLFSSLRETKRASHDIASAGIRAAQLPRIQRECLLLLIASRSLSLFVNGDFSPTNAGRVSSRRSRNDLDETRARPTNMAVRLRSLSGQPCIGSIHASWIIRSSIDRIVT